MSKLKGVFSLVVIVAALGYFVDLYDLVLFGVVKEDSLKAIGLTGEALSNAGISLLNYQMTGFLLGGILWGILGDLKGRLSVLFATIILYSAANIANGFVHDLTTYSILRLIAGIGLAGELGAGVTLVSESLPLEKRGYGTMIVVVFGALGAVLAAMVGGIGWRNAYFVGGGLGFALLLLRMGTHESHIYTGIKNATIRKGAFQKLFSSQKLFVKYLCCILIGLPVWFTIGVFIFSANEFAALVHVAGPVLTRKCIMYSYFGLAAGDLICGMLSQFLKSRRKAIITFLITSMISFVWYLFVRDISVTYFYFMCFMLGAFTGYWAIFVTVASEQFGTNLRATVTTTVPNFVRGSTVLITLSYVALRKFFESHTGSLSTGTKFAALTVGGICVLLALIAILTIKESFSKDLNYVEEIS